MDDRVGVETPGESGTTGEQTEVSEEALRRAAHVLVWRRGLRSALLQHAAHNPIAQQVLYAFCERRDAVLDPLMEPPEEVQPD